MTNNRPCTEQTTFCQKKKTKKQKQKQTNKLTILQSLDESTTSFTEIAYRLK